MPSDWLNLRSLNGSRQTGFEELCCQLAAGEPYPAGATFVRKGTPDAGVECFWTLPDGDEEGWQAKFFLGAMTDAQWTQIDESVETALALHPRLTRYVVCLPADRSDSRQGRGKSMLQKWEDRVKTWKGWAKNRPKPVAFEYWGDSELTSRLNTEANRGRHWFWFHSEQFTLGWFRARLTEAIRNAGERYTPELHVPLPLADAFAALGRTLAFDAKLDGLYSRLARAAEQAYPAQLPAELAPVKTSLGRAMPLISAPLDAALAHLGGRSPWRPRPIPWEDVATHAETLATEIEQAVRDARAARVGGKAAGSSDAQAQLRSIEERCWSCGRVADAAEALALYCRGREAALANRPALLLVGAAGQGKTHLLCDVAQGDMSEGQPRLLFHGSHFDKGDPWQQMVVALGLCCTTDEFLGAMDAAGQAHGCRALIHIDALNEGPGRGIWQTRLAGMLARLGSYPWIGIAVSVRDSYEDLVVPTGVVPDHLTRIVHHGFAGHESDAVHRYFAHYGIQPTSPLLVPEFSNPLFLKLFCQGVRAKGWSQVPPGIRAITSILGMLIDATNERLARPDRLDYDRRRNPVRGALSSLVALMAGRGTSYLPCDVAADAVNALLSDRGYDRSLYCNLVAEGLLSESRWPDGDDQREEVGFAYERFGDHMLARHLLGDRPTVQSVTEAFADGGALRPRLADQSAAYRNAGLVEALSIQLPELIEKELSEVAPHAAGFDAVLGAFPKSVVWRAAGAFTDATFQRFNDLLRYRGLRDNLYDAAISLAPVPSHPLNANKLHEVLSRCAMADRDVWWSTFLHREWTRPRAVERLIDWTRSADLRAMTDEVALLTGTALAWFLTTANRFVRDRATKALVRLFEGRLALLAQLLERFRDVDDPYVLERLVTAAYGSAMRSPDQAGLRELAMAVNEVVFRQDSAVPQLLTRDAARGLVGLARHRGAIGAGECVEAQPPHGSEWPGRDVPPLAAIEKYGEWTDDLPRDEAQLRVVYSGVMGTGLSDFSTYVIGDLDEWTRERIDGERPPGVEERIEQFLAELDPAQREAVERYRSSSSIDTLSDLELRELISRAETDSEGSEQAGIGEVSAEDVAAAASLKSHPKLAEFYRDVFKPFLDNPRQFRPEPFDGQLARRWMFQRVLDYGWTPERFGEFDHEMGFQRRGREAHKPERIGKKYQWVAYHELLARLADNFLVRADRWSDGDELKVCEGVWDIGGGFQRDIDPSVSIRASPRDDTKEAWWSPVAYSNWHAHGGESDWLRDGGDLPDVRPMLAVVDGQGTDWLVLDTHRHWDMPKGPGRQEAGLPGRQIWYVVRSYLVRKPDAKRFFRWAKKQDFMGRWMPEPFDVHRTYLGECYWSPAFRHEVGDGFEWSRDRYDQLSCDVLLTAFDHVSESGGRDCSVNESFQVTLPAPRIAEGMGLAWGGIEGEMVGPEGRVACLDPSARQAGPGALLVRREGFLRFLERENLELVWTLLGEKQVFAGSESMSKGWLQTSGAYRLMDGRIDGSDKPEYRTATRVRKSWAVRSARKVN